MDKQYVKLNGEIIKFVERAKQELSLSTVLRYLGGQLDIDEEEDIEAKLIRTVITESKLNQLWGLLDEFTVRDLELRYDI